MDEKTLTVTLSSGYPVKAAVGSYVVQFWTGGKWHNLAIFPGTEEGYEMAVLVSSHLVEDSSIAVFH